MKVDIEEIMDKCTDNLEKVYSNGNLVHGVSNLLLIILTKLGLISCRAIKRKFRMSYIILAQLLQPDSNSKPLGSKATRLYGIYTNIINILAARAIG